MYFVSLCFKNDTGLSSKSKTKNQDWVILQCLERYYFGAPQGSILGLLLFNIFLCDFFLEYGNNYFANYADNTKIYIVDENTKEVLTNLSALANIHNIHMAG